jgi:hypothetical protein
MSDDSEKPEVPSLAEVFIPDFREILDDGRRMSIAIQVKHNGKWRVHKSDADKNFPSDFHADRVDEAEKLDLYTGDVWSPITRKHLYVMPKKAMRYIFRELSKTKEENLQVLMADKSKFGYLN